MRTDGKERAAVTGIQVVDRTKRAPDTDMPAGKRKKFAGERLFRNALAALVVLFCVATASNIALPGGQSVRETLRDAVSYDWDDSLGKLTFVSGLLPESVAVFWTAKEELALVAPCVGSVVHAFSREEPYIGYESQSVVYAPAGGEVTTVAHNDAEERIVKIAHENGIETVLYGLSVCFVQVGDMVSAKSALGLPGADGRVYWEAREEGIARDVTHMALARDTQ